MGNNSRCEHILLDSNRMVYSRDAECVGDNLVHTPGFFLTLSLLL